jgi:hypothetical protein
MLGHALVGTGACSSEAMLLGDSSVDWAVWPRNSGPTSLGLVWNGHFLNGSPRN